MTQGLLLGTAFYLLWIGLSGIFSPFLVATSIISVVGVLLLLRRLGLVSGQYQPFALIPALLAYWGWLLVEIVKSNIDVARSVLGLGNPISPTMAWVQSSQKSEFCRTLYANSITLTPGTITVLAEGDQFLVHALRQEGIEGLLTGDMDRRCAILDARFTKRPA